MKCEATIYEIENSEKLCPHCGCNYGDNHVYRWKINAPNWTMVSNNWSTTFQGCMASLNQVRRNLSNIEIVKVNKDWTNFLGLMV